MTERKDGRRGEPLDCRSTAANWQNRGDDTRRAIRYDEISEITGVNSEWNGGIRIREIGNWQLLPAAREQNSRLGKLGMKSMDAVTAFPRAATTIESYARSLL